MNFRSLTLSCLVCFYLATDLVFFLKSRKSNPVSPAASIVNLILLFYVWKRFRDDVFVLWEHGTASLSSFSDYLNTMDKIGKIKFTIEIAGDTGLELLDLKLKINEDKIRVDVFAKSTNSFRYTTPNTCYPKNNICNIPRSIALRLRRTCDDDETFKK